MPRGTTAEAAGYGAQGSHLPSPAGHAGAATRPLAPRASPANRTQCRLRIRSQGDQPVVMRDARCVIWSWWNGEPGGNRTLSRGLANHAPPREPAHGSRGRRAAPAARREATRGRTRRRSEQRESHPHHWFGRPGPYSWTMLANGRESPASGRERRDARGRAQWNRRESHSHIPGANRALSS